ncbi:related to UBP2 - ubiquitin-specific proteinase [Melanopsichium pennsylvanicum]|uniref:ubiquitinyl hydrolase 1 n=1 Tax=Melanopsichium pennsylvanicum TaxID=63383 RepID=A0AAJ4XKV9_9BASI|nr:related to UBP2 - ubiquitin-specific proteinase [Melanopsichium pennsylvanicum]
MGFQRSQIDSINIVDNVTRPTESSVQSIKRATTASSAVDENETIDITINEDDHRNVFGSQSSVPLQLPLRPATQTSIAHKSASRDAPRASPPPSYDHVLQSPTHVHPMALSRIGFVRDSPIDPRATAVYAIPPPAASGTTSGSITTQPTPSPSELAQTPSLAQINACKPHPDALFTAETLEWRLIFDQHQMYRIPPPHEPIHKAEPIYDACSLMPGSVSMYETNPISIAAQAQRNPVQLLERWNSKNPHAPLPTLEEFNKHSCYLTGKRLYTSPPDSIVSVVDRQLLMHFKENRENNPAVGLTGIEHFVRALGILVRIIGNFVHGERRGAPTTSTIITQKLGWDQSSRQIFSALGWMEDKMPDGRNAIIPPPTRSTSATSIPTDQGSSHASTDPPAPAIILRRNIRAWIELSVWMAFHLDQLRINRPSSSLLSSAEPILATRLVTESASQSILELIGLGQQHLDTSYKKDVPSTTLEAFFLLGASSINRDELIKFAYLINMEANLDRRAVELFGCLDEIYNTQRRTSRVLEELVVYERSQGRYSLRDLDKAYERLHLSPTHLGPDVERDSIPLDLIVDNYKARAREVLINSDASEHAAVKDALKIITHHLGKPERLVQALDEHVDMDIEQAYTMLDANPDLDDPTLLAIFDLYIADAPARRDLMRHALRAIAEHRKSEYLRHFLSTGERDASTAESWQQLPSNDLPAGIENIGNTCYLNSVLQYFFSITEVRTRVLQAAATVQAGAGLPDDLARAPDLQADTGRRVGGQHITVRELQRSRRFVAQLADLFRQLIHANSLSVRPERELAYLALVSSRAEELEGEFSSIAEADVQDAPQLSSDPAPIEPSLPAQAPTPVASVNGDVQSMDTTPDESIAIQTAESTPGTTVTASAPPPPLPPRPARNSTVTDAIPTPARRNSLMQLGAQQDVSECLDNCMFQLEVALAISKDASIPSTSSTKDSMEVDGGGGAGDGASEDLLTNLFLGKTCQRIEADTITATNVQNNHDPNGTVIRPPQPHKQPSTHIKHEVFKILPIDVLEEGRDVYDGFDGFFDSDTFVATSGAVQRRSVTLLSAPPLLQIQLQRVQYDRVTMRAFKSQAHLDMPETLYMDRYMDLDPSQGDNASRIVKRLDCQAKRRRIEELRAQLAACKDGANLHLTQTLSQAANTVEELAKLPPLADFAAQLDEIKTESAQADTESAVLSSPRSRAKQAASLGEESQNDAQSQHAQKSTNSSVASVASASSDGPFPPALSALIDAGLSNLLHEESKLLREQMERAKREIETLKTEMASIWADERRFPYRLVAVFMHRGEASHGHYFLNLRGGGEDAKWFKYNDSAVTGTSLDQVLRDRSSATPYLVTYVREDYVHLIDPICRTIDVEQVQQQQHQSGMEVEEATVQDIVAGWESEPKPTATATGAGEAIKPSVVTDVQTASGETAKGNESPIKRARTDDL